MTTEPVFSIRESAQREMITIEFEGRPLRVPAGISVAAALLASGINSFRSSVVGHAPRAPYCMMGVCFECLVEIDNYPARQSCLIPVRDGMRVQRQVGASEIDVSGNL